MKKITSLFTKKSIFYILSLSVIGALCYILCYELSYAMEFFNNLLRPISGEPELFFYWRAYVWIFLVGIAFCFLYKKEVSRISKIFTVGCNPFLAYGFLLPHEYDSIIAGAPIAVKHFIVWIFVLITVAEMVFIIIDMVRNIKNKNF